MQRWLLLLLIALSYALFGGGPGWTMAPLWALSALIIVVAPVRILFFPNDLRLLDMALSVLLAGICLQLLPLPQDVVDTVSPHAVRLETALHLQLLGQGRAGPGHLTVNPRATAEALSTVALGIVTFWSARGVFSAGGGVRQFCRALAFVGGAAAISAIVLRAVTPGLVNGVLQPDVRSANPFGAFINRNHFGGWALMASGPVWGYLIAHVRMHPAYRLRFLVKFRQFLASGAAITAMSVVAMTGALILTLSRSAVIGLGAAALCGWGLGRQRLRIERTSLPTALALIGMALVAGVLFVDIGGWTGRLGESLDASANAWSRWTIWRESMPIMADFWATGTGAGTFSDTMTIYQQSRIWVGSMNQWAHFNNAHSQYIQVAAEGGLLLVIPVVIAIVSFWQAGRRAIRSDHGEMFWVRIGAFAGLVGVAVQGTWEVSLVMPANALLAGVLGGLVLYRRPPHAHSEKNMMAGAA